MSKKTRYGRESVEADFKALKAAGYEVRKFSPVHWHVKKQGTRVAVNVWPTAKKYMRQYDHGAQFYTDVTAAMTSAFAGAPKVKIYNRPNHAEQVEAQRNLVEMRKGGLDYIRKLAKKHG